MISDPDGDTLTYTATGLPMGLTIDAATGEITGTIDNSASQAGPDSDGVYTVIVTADDGEGGTVTDTFDITVTNPGPDAVDDVLTIAEDNALTDNVMTPNDSDPDLIRQLLVEQVTGSVRWRESVQYMAAQGVTETWEIGAGKALSGMIRKIERAIAGKSVGTPEDVQKAIEAES